MFYELYNEPHISDMGAYMHGNTETAGMIEMLQAVRAYSQTPVIIAGATLYVYYVYYVYDV